jgi:hypothetical protein
MESANLWLHEEPVAPEQQDVLEILLATGGLYADTDRNQRELEEAAGSPPHATRRPDQQPASAASTREPPERACASGPPSESRRQQQHQQQQQPPKPPPQETSRAIRAELLDAFRTALAVVNDRPDRRWAREFLLDQSPIVVAQTMTNPVVLPHAVSMENFDTAIEPDGTHCGMFDIVNHFRGTFVPLVRF